MAEMHHQIPIDASPEKVYEAIATQKGLQGWWTGNSHFIHGDWRSTSGHFALCNSTWGILMYRLKDYVEGKDPGPYWEK